MLVSIDLDVVLGFEKDVNTKRNEIAGASAK